MVVHARKPWGLPRCAALRWNHVKTPGGLSFQGGGQIFNFPSIQTAQATTAAARESHPSEAYVNEAARAQLLAAPNSARARCGKGQVFRSRLGTDGNSTSTSKNGASSNTSSNNKGSGDDGSLDCSGQDEEALQDAVEESFSVFDVIYRNSVSPRDRSTTIPTKQNAKPTGPAVEEPEDIQRALVSTQSLSNPFPSSKTKEGPAVLLSVLRDLTNARVRTAEAWAPPLLLLMQQLPLLSSSEVQQTAALLASAGCRPPLLLQGLCEAFKWRAEAKQTEASQTVLFLDSLRRLRYLPCAAHLRAYFAALERRRKSLTVGDLLKIQRFVDELNVPSDLASLPFLVSVLTQLRRNTAALKPPEAAALASLLLKRQELDRKTAERLSAAVYEHLGGASSVLLLQQEPLFPVSALHNGQAQMPDHVKLQYHQDMLRRQQERLASPSSLSALLHLGNSLVAANLKQVPSAFCWALEREVELHWAAMTPTEVSATLNLLAKMKHRPTSALNKLGLAVQHSLHLYTPNLLSGCLLSFDILLYRHRSLLSSLSTFLLNKQIASPHHHQKRQERRQQYPRPSPRFVSQLSAVSATMPTAAAKTPALTATEAYIASRQHNLGQMQHQKEQEPSLGSEAEAQARRPFSLNELQPVERLPPDAHLPPPLAFDRHTRKDDIETTHLLEQVEMPKDALDRLVPSDGLSGNSRCFKSADSPGVSGLTAAPRRSTISLQSRAGAAAVALTVRGADIPCSVGVSIDPFLAAALLQHLSHIQHYKDPELLSRLLASVSAATANYGQQRMQHLLEPESDSRLRGSCPVPVTENSAGFPLVTCAESVHHVAEAANEVAATTVVASTSEVSFSTVASAGDPAALTANEATVRRRRGTPIGTHELHESWAEFASAAITAADALLPRWGKTRRASFSGPAPEASRRHGGEDNRTGGAELLNETVSSRGKSQPSGSHGVPSDQDTIRRLKEQGLHRALQFVTLPWSTFVSQFRKAIDLGTSRERPHTRNRLARKRRRTVNGFVPAGAEVARTVTKREVRFARLYRIWGSRGPPGLCRLRRRHLRRLAMKMRAAVTVTPRPSAAESTPSSGWQQRAGDRSRAASVSPGTATHSITAVPVSSGRRRNIVYGKCAADSMRRWACCRRAFLQPFQLVSLFSRQYPPSIGAEATASARTDSSGNAQLPPQPQLQLPSHQIFPFGISFADTAGTQALLMDTGPLLPPVLPKDAPSSLKKQVKQQHDKKMKCARQAQALLQRHQQRLHLPGGIDSPSAGASTATVTAGTANPPTVQAIGITSTSEQPPAFQSVPMICPGDSIQSAATPKPARARKDEQHRSRLLHAAAGALCAAANMKILTLRIARPFVLQLPFLCAESSCVATGTKAAAKDLSACCAAAAAALQTLGLRLDEPVNYAHSARRRNPRPPTPDLAVIRVELLISLEMAFRSPRFVALWRQAATDAASLDHILTQHRAEDNPQRRLAHLLPQAAYLYSVVFQALVNDVQRESTPSSVPKQQHSKQSLTMVLQQTEKEIMRKLEQALTDTDANTEDLPSKDIRSSLVALVRSHQSTRRSAPPATVKSAAEAEASFHPVVYALASKLHLTRNTIHRWVAEAAGAEELRLQRNQPS